MEDPKSSRKRRRVPDPSVDLTDTKFGSLRRVLQELRPYILEVLRTPDYYNSRAAPVIRQGTKQVKDLCKQLRAETVSLAKQKKTNDGTFAVKENGDDQSVKRQPEVPIFVDDQAQSLVGCSPDGWNFILIQNSARKEAS